MKRETGNDNKETTMKTNNDNRNIRKQSQPEPFWSATLKRMVTVPE
jgi:hypothetical protein